jgi:glycine/D-amino acid oxidase-like deaminating enzyme
LPAPPASRVVVVGAGIIGHACAWAIQRRGRAVTLVDRDFESAATGELIADFVTEAEPPIDPRPYSIGRFVTRPSPRTP